MPRAIATSMHLGPASSQMACSIYSTRQVGRLLRQALPRGLELKAYASMSAPACAGCGDSVGSRSEDCGLPPWCCEFSAPGKKFRLCSLAHRTSGTEDIG